MGIKEITVYIVTQLMQYLYIFKVKIEDTQKTKLKFHLFYSKQPYHLTQIVQG